MHWFDFEQMTDFLWVFLQTLGSVLDYEFIYNKIVTLTHSNPKYGANVPQEKNMHHNVEDEQQIFSLHKSGLMSAERGPEKIVYSDFFHFDW